MDTFSYGSPVGERSSRGSPEGALEQPHGAATLLSMRQRSPKASTGVLLALLALPGSGCRVAAARVWNLREVHEPSGKPRRRARTRSDAAYVLQRTLRTLSIGDEQDNEAEERPIRDPFGTCFENVRALADCNLDKDMTAGLMAEAFAWLAVDCTYVLSRERAARTLGPLAVRLEVEKALPPPEEPAGPEELRRAYETLVLAAAPVVRGEGGSVLDVRAACEGIGELRPDRQGSLRLLRAANVLLEEGSGSSALDPLRGLQRSLARRAVAFALHTGMEDGDGRVVAGFLSARLRLAGEDREGLLEWTLASPHEGLRHFEDLALEAVNWIARNGLPPQRLRGDGQGLPSEALRRDRWIQAFIEMLAEVEGPLLAACSRALGKLTGRPATLRPEEWLAWWRWERPDAPAAPPSAEPRAGSSYPSTFAAQDEGGS